MIETRNLSVQYGAKSVLKNINIRFDTGEITALIGANGCGKSTLLRMIAGLQSPDQGHVLLHGKAITQHSRRAIAREIGYLSQSPQAPEGVTVRQLVEHGAFSGTRLFRRPAVQAVDEVMDRVDLLSYADRPFDTLSGGERQRGWIALTLLQAPKILLLDEPTSFLDMGYRIDIMRLVEELKSERGMGVIMVLHDLNEAARFADRIVALKDGGILRDGDKSVVDARLPEALFGAKVSVLPSGDGVPFIKPDW
ncbi:MAG: ABC transporter ATP-binding protein [Pseudomonadota bacterium]